MNVEKVHGVHVRWPEVSLFGWPEIEGLAYLTVTAIAWWVGFWLLSKHG